jgi:apolipoprotein D and lipocalin family protein
MRMVMSGTMLLLSLSCASGPGPGTPLLELVPQVDLSRYAGVWYEIASFPQRFQAGCADTKAVYTLQSDGTVAVLNSCFRKG